MDTKGKQVVDVPPWLIKTGLIYKYDDFEIVSMIRYLTDRYGDAENNVEHSALIQKVMKGEASEAESEWFQTLHHQKTCEVLEAPIDAIFVITETSCELPPRARMEPSVICTRCGEPTMPAKMVAAGTDRICRGCDA